MLTPDQCVKIAEVMDETGLKITDLFGPHIVFIGIGVGCFIWLIIIGL